LAATIKEVGFLGGGIRQVVQILQAIVAILIVGYLPVKDGLQRYALVLLRAGNYRAMMEGTCQVSYFEGRVETTLRKRAKSLTWQHREKIVLILSRDYLAWRDGDRFSLSWLDKRAIDSQDRIYIAQIVPVFISALNMYYLVLYDSGGNYAGVILLVWHS